MDLTILFELIAYEGLYQTLAAQFLTHRIFLSRKEFAEQVYTVAVTCDQMILMLKAGIPLNLLMQKPAAANGRGGPRLVR